MRGWISVAQTRKNDLPTLPHEWLAQNFFSLVITEGERVHEKTSLIIYQIQIQQILTNQVTWPFLNAVPSLNLSENIPNGKAEIIVFEEQK